MIKAEDGWKFRTIESASGALQLEFCAEAGGSITNFHYREDDRVVEIFRRWYGGKKKESPWNIMASFPLTPYSNRIIKGKLTVDGTTYKVGPEMLGEFHNQLHGDGWILPWEVTSHEKNRATLELTREKEPSLTPYAYHAKQNFTLEDNRLEIAMEVTNHSGIRLPFGLGHHPFFHRDDKTVLRANLPKVWLSGENMAPKELIDTPEKWDFSNGIELANDHFRPAEQGFWKNELMDNCFQGWDHKAEITWPDKELSLTISAEPVFANFVIYIPTLEPFFCAEPVTNIIDGFNLHERGVKDTGTVFLNEGETLTGKMWFSVGTM